VLPVPFRGQNGFPELSYRRLGKMILSRMICGADGIGREEAQGARISEGVEFFGREGTQGTQKD